MGEGDEVVTSPFSFVASANAALYERARPVFADIDPVTLNLDPQAAAAAVGERTRALLPVHIFGYPADMAAFERLAGRARPGDRRGRLRGARRRARATARAVGGRGHPAVFGFYANKQLTTGEGGMITLADAAHEGADRLRAQPGPRARTWAGSTTTAWASTTASSDIACALGHRPAGAAGGDARRARARRAALPRGARWDRRAGAAVPGSADGDRRGWFVFVVQLPHGVDRDGAVRALAAVGIQSKPYLPAIHLMSFYRERFGHREGEFPVCEDVAARSLALPFFPEMSEGQVRAWPSGSPRCWRRARPP